MNCTLIFSQRNVYNFFFFFKSPYIEKEHLFLAGRKKATIPRRTVRSTSDYVDLSSSALQDKKLLLRNCGKETRERKK